VQRTIQLTKFALFSPQSLHFLVFSFFLYFHCVPFAALVVTSQFLATANAAGQKGKSDWNVRAPFKSHGNKKGKI